MNPTILYGLVAMVGWGVGDIFVTKLARKHGNRKAFFWLFLSGFLVTSLYIPFTGRLPETGMFLLAIILGLVNCGGGLLYLHGLEHANASVVVTISNAFGIVTSVAAVLFFKERISVLQSTGILAAAVGVTLATLDFRYVKKHGFIKMLKERTTLFPIVTLLLWGIYYTFIRIPVERIGWFWAAYPVNFGFILMPVFGLVKRDVVSVIRDRSTFMILLAIVVCLNMALFGFNIGLTYGNSSIVAPIAASAPVLFVILSRYFFHDKLTTQQKWGIAATLTGIVFISVGSSDMFP